MPDGTHRESRGAGNVAAAATRCHQHRHTHTLAHPLLPDPLFQTHLVLPARLHRCIDRRRLRHLGSPLGRRQRRGTRVRLRDRNASHASSQADEVGLELQAQPGEHGSARRPERVEQAWCVGGVSREAAEPMCRAEPCSRRGTLPLSKHELTTSHSPALRAHTFELWLGSHPVHVALCVLPGAATLAVDALCGM